MSGPHTLTRKQKKDPRDIGIIRKKGPGGRIDWYARIVRKDSTGKRKEYLARADNKTHARKLRNQLASDYDLRGATGLEGAKLSFARACEIFKAERLIAAQYHEHGGRITKVAGLKSLKTSHNYLNVIKNYFGNRRLGSITYVDLVKFKTERLQTPSKRGVRSIADVNRSLATLKSLFKFALQNAWIVQSPFDRGPSLIHLSDEVRRERVLSFPEEKALLAACDSERLVSYKRKGQPITARLKQGRQLLKALVIVAVDTALRKGELLKLEWRDIDFDRNVITARAENTKTHRTRKIGMTGRVREQLASLWQSSIRELEFPVFGVTDFKKSFGAACAEAKIHDLRFHDLRHAAITRMVEVGLPPMEIMKVSGHTQWNTFARYVNPGDEAIQRIARVLTAHHMPNSEPLLHSR